MDYLIGHLVGDFILQNDWQAMNKKANTLKGWVACLVHCILYTLAVCLCTGWWKPHLIGLVFLSHFPIDKTYIVAWFMIKSGSFRRIIGDQSVWYRCPACGIYKPTNTLDGRCFGKKRYPVRDGGGRGNVIAEVFCDGMMEKDEWRNETDMRHKVWAYLLVDNTVHITLLWLIARFAI